MTNQLIFILILALELFCYNTVLASDACLIDKNHIFCEDAKHTGSSDCANTDEVALTDDSKEDILKIFNSKRQKVASQFGIWYKLVDSSTGKKRINFFMEPASNMLQLEWHDELAKAAKKITGFCNDSLTWCTSCLQVDSMPATWVYTFLPKQNTTEGYSRNLEIDSKDEIIDTDLSTIQDMGTVSLLPYRWRTSGRAQFVRTAVLHSYTNYVGCSRITSWKNSEEVFETCLFAPLPIEETTILYKKGPACSNCPKGYLCSEEFKGLCKRKLNNELGNIDAEGYCKFHKKHVLCDVWSQAEKLRNEALCKGKAPTALTEFNKHEILKSYNKFRKDIANGRSATLQGLPNAADMMELGWSLELQKAADNIRDICSTEDLTPEQLKFGNNGELQAKVVTVYHNGSDFQEALSKSIGLQGIPLDKSVIQNYNSDPKYDLLSALAFSQTRHLGCSRQTPHLDANNQPVMKEVCIFATTERVNETISKKGAKTKDTLYLEGRKCSKCPDGFSCHEGLCKAIDSGIDIPEDFCGVDPKHIMCETWKGNTKPGQDKTLLNVTEHDKARILAAYNKFRKDLAQGKSLILPEMPTAANMIELKWDKDLQIGAEKVLQKSSFKDVVDGQLKYGHHGELQGKLISLQHNGENFWEKLAKAFKDEGVNFDPTQISNNSVTGVAGNLLTALANADARYLGCARQTPEVKNSVPGEFEEVCIIGPTEKETDNLYITGEACAICPENYECDEGLCEPFQPGIDTRLDYCKIDQKHMLCYSWDRELDYGDPTKCITNGLTDKNTVTVLTTANKFRRDLAFGVEKELKNSPKAADMNELEWDNELADVAANIGRLCSEKKILPEQIKFGHHGELEADVIYIRHNGTDFEEAFLKALQEGGKNFQLSQIGNNQNTKDVESNSMFKTLAFYKARFLGCAQQVKVNKTKTPNDVLEVCVVGPTTEKNNSLPTLFTFGEPCSKCKFGFECNDGLCKRKPLIRGQSNEDYCKIDAEHILCDKWTNRSDVIGNPELCKGKAKNEITDPEKAAILGTYNQLRNDNAEHPKATVMNTLVWNSNLQEAAENVLYVCSTKELRPEQLAFGSNGEQEARIMRVRHNKKNFKDKLAEALRKEGGQIDGKGQFPSDLSKAAYVGCARLTPAYEGSEPDEIEEVCVIGLNKKESENSLSATGDGCASTGSCVSHVIVATTTASTTTSTSSTTTTTTTFKLPNQGVVDREGNDYDSGNYDSESESNSEAEKSKSKKGGEGDGADATTSRSSLLTAFLKLIASSIIVTLIASN